MESPANEVKSAVCRLKSLCKSKTAGYDKGALVQAKCSEDDLADGLELLGVAAG